VRLVLCDDHRLFAEPFAAALNGRGHEVVLTTTPADGVRAVELHHPDVFVVDIRFPEGDGFDAVAIVRQRRPECRIVVLSGSDDYRHVAAASAAGAVAFLRKDQAVSVVFDALEQVAAGSVPPSRAAPSPAAGDDKERRGPLLLANLTDRERQVLDRLLEAEDTAGIARSLGVAPSTVRTHLQNVLVKLGVHNRLQAVTLALEAGMGSRR
jgi:DNA-binding NarL/FixJ family response regulator